MGATVVTPLIPILTSHFCFLPWVLPLLLYINHIIPLKWKEWASHGCQAIFHSGERVPLIVPGRGKKSESQWFGVGPRNRKPPWDGLQIYRVILPWILLIFGYSTVQTISYETFWRQIHGDFVAVFHWTFHRRRGSLRRDIQCQGGEWVPLGI